MRTKILFITGSYSDGGGTANVITTLVNNLDYTKYEISLFQFYDAGIKKEPITENVQHLMPLLDSNVVYDDEFNYILKYQPKILKQITNMDDYDIVIGWDTHFFLNAFNNTPLISWLHSGIDNINQKSKSFKMTNKAWQKAQAIVTISNWPYQSLTKQFPSLKNKTRIIYNGIDSQLINNKSLEKVDYNIQFKNPSLPLICAVGRLDGVKNPTLLAKTLPFLKNKCNVVFIGRGEEKKKIEQIVKQENLEDYVYFTGFQSNPYPLMKQATLICLTSISETFGMSIAEGMILGKPFVTTPVAGASEELSNNGKCGLVSDYDPRNFAQRIDDILTNKSEYKKMSKNCIEHVKQFSIEKSIENFDALIESLQVDLEKSVKPQTVPIIYCQFAHYCVISCLDKIEMSKNIFIESKTFYNFAKMCYYHLRTLALLALYPIRFFKYYTVGKLITQQYNRQK